ncbi:FMN-binding negative transcriptional regulator [Mucilaginibacter ginkgonis]|uniref:FMN-binding negative transcriptional regulator n=1 Tax=Mucilaginibacter ginkgonis TaxID=2682091 RepID=A0A7T7FD34_9SPHI|nr:FMN-binding negative transcriptional regulator [Mucilaginibacter ginkgonis]
MYVPHQFRAEDQNEAIEFIKRFSFGILVSTQNSLPIATHIPFVVTEEGDKVKLSSHCFG